MISDYAGYQEGGIPWSWQIATPTRTNDEVNGGKQYSLSYRLRRVSYWLRKRRKTKDASLGPASESGSQNKWWRHHALGSFNTKRASGVVTQVEDAAALVTKTRQVSIIWRHQIFILFIFLAFALLRRTTRRTTIRLEAIVGHRNDVGDAAKIGGDGCPAHL